ncbi:MAG: V-type ATP synthase subunit D [Acholeplasmatales bacterium]|jgi:V/A-type H+-transporting ATPase subunit D|nr:V-type ATP synthase subunit D [Acholeplasmatales bacterium]
MSAILPTKSNLINLKNTLVLAKNGLELMNQKRNILLSEITKLTPQIEKLKTKIASIFSSSYNSLKKANVTLGLSVLSNYEFKEDNNYKIEYKNIMGVVIPQLLYEGKFENPSITYHFSVANSFFDESLIEFSSLKELLIELANIDAKSFKLAINIKKTAKRASSLENSVIPKIVNDIKYISEYLDEKEREEFSRNKIIKKKK